jgi:DNA-binding SARP family transcriptional activator
MRQVDPKTRRPSEPATERPVAAPVRLCLFGKMAVYAAEREIEIANRKCRALLGYLALSDAAEETRERLIGLLWSETEEERARASLRQALYEIRTAFELGGLNELSATKLAVALDRSRVVADVWAVLAEAKEGRVDPLLLDIERLSDTLLAEFETIDPAFRVWLLAKRQTLHDRLVRYLEQALRQDHANAAKTDLAHALLNLDPTHEEAARLLMQLRAEVGDIGGALAIYKRLWDLLDQEYDVEPSPETQDLIVQLKQAQPAEPRVVTKPQGTKRLLISLAPFDAGGVPADKRHLVTGLSHELIACLARFREWSVRTIASITETEPRSWSSPPEYFVEGSAYEHRGTIRLVITFRDAVTSVCIWSERYNVTLAEWFDIQQQIVRRIATVLNVHVSAERLRRATAEPEIPLEIHDRWLRGQELMHQVTPSEMKAAAAIFSELMRDAPDFSPALSGMVQINNMDHITFPGHFRDRNKHLATLRLAQRAVQLDPLDSRAQLGLAWSHQLVGRTEESTLHAALAAELNEGDPWTLMACGQIFAYCGDYERAQALARTSLELSLAPSRSQMTYFSAIKFLCGAYEESVQAAMRGLDESPGFSVWKCAALAHLGRLEQARAEIKQVLSRSETGWTGPGRPTAQDVLRWLLQMFPIAVEQDWERLRAGFKAAGAPVDSIAFYRS